MVQPFVDLPNVFYAVAQPIMRRGLCCILGAGKTCDSDSAESLDEVLTVLERHGPRDFDLIILGLDLPGLDGPRGIGALREAGVDMPVLAFSLSHDPGEFVAVMAAGAGGVIQSDASAEEVRKAAVQVAEGRSYVPAQDEGRVPVQTPGLDAEVTKERLKRLTKRQREVLALMSQGMSNKEIGRELDLAEATVKAHNYAIFNALGVHRRVQALSLLGGTALQEDILTFLTML